MMWASRHLFAAMLILASALGTGSAHAEESKSDALEIFNQRILPIFRSSDPSSCVQCHLAGVDLKNYILPSSEKTFLSLRDQGLIDLESPQDSKILKLIRMGERDLDQGAKLIHEKTRKAEEEAFAAWLAACCNDPDLRSLPALSETERAGPEKPLEVIRHARKSRIVDSFARHVWSQRMRCFPCHTPYEVDPQNPRHKAAVKKLAEFEEQYGKNVERLHLFRETPEASLNYLIGASQSTKDGDLPLINLADPRKSLLVLKPTSKLPAKRDDGTFEPPSSSEPVSHMGGLKMHPDDQSYKAFVAWLEDYAKVVGNEYTAVEELPQDNWHPSQQVLRVTGTPADWPVGAPVQLILHAWDASRDQWDPEPLAFTQGTVTPRGIVNGAMFRLAEEGDSLDNEHALVPPGRYQLRAYVDLKERLKADPTAFLSAEALKGTVEVKVDRWREGFRDAKAVPWSEFTSN